MLNENWYSIKKNAASVFEFLDMFWNFHDFRVFSIKYDASKNRIDLVLEYDSRTIRVLLRFEGCIDMNFCPAQDFEADWMFGATLCFDEINRFVWIADDECSTVDDLPRYITWIKGMELYYALVDKDDNPIEIPHCILNSDFGKKDWKTMNKHFSPTPSTSSLKPEKTYSLPMGTSISVSYQDLIKNYPPRFKNAVKADLYKMALDVHKDDQGDVRATQCWFNTECLKNEKMPFNPIEIKSKKSFFNYAGDTDSENRIVWYLNFSDINLFATYGSDLFYQSEMQVFEHPILCSLKEYLLKNRITSFDARTVFTPRIDGNATPTPVLIESVPYWLTVDAGLCGERFVHASQEELGAGIKMFEGQVRSNIIAMTALYGKGGKYKKWQIDFTLKTALCAFEKARFLSVAHHELNEKLKTVIHTGNWGCGCFGGSKNFMYLAQMIAASCVGVNEIVFHEIDEAAFENASREFEQIKGMPMTFVNLVDFLYNKGFCWNIV